MKNLKVVLMSHMGDKSLEDCIKDIDRKTKNIISSDERKSISKEVLKRYILSDGLSITQIREIFEINQSYFDDDVREKIYGGIDELMDQVTEELAKITEESDSPDAKE